MDLPIGYDIFPELIEFKLDFVDKSLFIKEVIDKSAKATVITRPRRFGKTLNLSMLHHFLAAEAYGRSTKGLFDNLKIAKAGGEYMQHQGKYPVIFVTFKDILDWRFAENISK
jgi:Predicted AAA-ATPase